MNKVIIYLGAVLLPCSCNTQKHYSVLQYDNGNDSIHEGTYRIVDKKAASDMRTRTAER